MTYYSIKIRVPTSALTITFDSNMFTPKTKAKAT